MNIHEKYNKYKEMIKNQAQDGDGFIEWSHCDSLLFTGLLCSSPDFHACIDEAYDGEFWHRRSLNQPRCFDMEKCVGTGSASSISRDMLVGLAWYCWYNRRGDIAEKIVQHAMKNYGFMGKAAELKVKIGRCQIMPPLFATFCWISYKLGSGPMRPWALWVPADLGTKEDDYPAHLQVLHIMLRTDICGWSWPQEKGILQYHAKRRPENPLYQVAVGNKKEALDILTREDWWPSDRLPTNEDRKTHWIPMREPKDWKPNPRGKSETWSGGDLAFVYWLATRS